MHISVLLETPQDQLDINRLANGTIHWMKTRLAAGEEIHGEFKLGSLPKGTLGRMYTRARGITLAIYYANDRSTVDGVYYSDSKVVMVHTPFKSSEEMRELGSMTAEQWKHMHTVLVHEFRHALDHALSDKTPGRGGRNKWASGKKEYLKRTTEINARFTEVTSELINIHQETPFTSLSEFLRKFEGIAARHKLMHIFDTDRPSQTYKMAKDKKGETDFFGRNTPTLYEILIDTDADPKQLHGPVDDPQYRRLIQRAVALYGKLTNG